ncbi:MAG TPA: class I SAM-dependent rRNA methyltransferase [Candidatus Binataceae bacterium]
MASTLDQPASALARVILKKGRDGPVRGMNPWIFSQAIERVDPAPLERGALVEVRDSRGELLGAGYFNPATTIAVRMLAFGAHTDLATVVAARLADAIELRRRVVPEDTTCCRLVNGDGDGLSGLVVDRYADVLVVQFLTAGMDRMRDDVLRVLRDGVGPRTIIERSAGSVRREEGLTDRAGLLWGDAADAVIATENGFRITVAPGRGQKTGYFLDQRENRRCAGMLARGARVLDACCYAGGFSLAALAGGAAQVTAIDTSAPALEWARRNLELNCLLDQRVELICEDAGRYLARCSRQFELIVLDPPPFARSRKDVPRAQRMYIEMNQLAMRALGPGGILMTFSCSQHFRGEDFFGALRTAQVKAGRSLRTLRRLGAGPDHPVMLGHVEGEYLTGALLARS